MFENQSAIIGGFMKTSRLTVLVILSIFTLAYSFSEKSKYSFDGNYLDMDNLSFQERIDIYNSLKTDSGTATFLNGIIGFGSGSFYQNDQFGGLIGFSGDSLGIALASSGAYCIQTFKGDETPYLIMSFSGITIYVASKLFQLIRAGSFSKKENTKLWEAVFHN
jgi:hypothetical protein